MAVEIINTFDHPIFKEKEGPFVSIYQNTHRDPSKNEEDSIRFKNLLKDVRNQLESLYPDQPLENLIEPLDEIEKDTPFWNHTQEGIAVFSSVNHTVAFLFSHPLRDMAHVSDALHTLPLIRAFQSMDEYHVLALSKDRFRLFTGTRDKVDEIRFDDTVPTTKEEVLGELQTENRVTHGSYGRGGSAQYHGHDDAKDVDAVDMERFFRYVDRFVFDHYTKQSDNPLILWALPEYQGMFRDISRNQNLMEEGIRRSTQDLNEDLVRRMTWAIMEPVYEKRADKLAEGYNTAVFKKIGADVLKDVFEAAGQGRVDTILIEEGRVIPGYLDESGNPVVLNEPSPRTHDLLDTAAKLVSDQGGDVAVLAKDKMPTTTGLAAILRY